MKSTLTNGVGCEAGCLSCRMTYCYQNFYSGTHNSMSYTCYEANIILKIISGLSKLGKTDSQNWLVKSWNSRRTPNCPSWETYFQRNYILY